MEEINAIAQSTGLAVIEDAAQAIGPATTAVSPATSATSDVQLLSVKEPGRSRRRWHGDHERLGASRSSQVLRLHGSRSKYHYEILGLNSRLDTLQAAVLRVNCVISTSDHGRRRNASLYRSLFAQAN